MYQRIAKLTSVEDIKKQFPLPDELKAKKDEFDDEIKAIISGKGKFLLIVGPCSADDPSAVLSYCEKLRAICDKVSDKIFIVPRVYTTKPRSEAGAYRGILHSPDGKTDDIGGGIVTSRRLMLDIAEKFGLFAADEMLYPELYPYFDDVISYVTVGARSCENQLHRMVASGLNVAVGFKNPMNGNLVSLVQAVGTANRENRFALGGYEVKTSGNAFAHGILRGFNDENGQMHPNYTREFIESYVSISSEHGTSPSLIVDCNHANSGKDCFAEPSVALKVVDMIKSGAKNVCGLMIESYLFDGRLEGGKFGVSRTDPCLGIEKTERLIYDIAERL